MSSIQTKEVEGFQRKIAKTIQAWKKANGYQNPSVDLSQEYSAQNGLQKALIRQIYSQATNVNP